MPFDATVPTYCELLEAPSVHVSGPWGAPGYRPTTFLAL